MSQLSEAINNEKGGMWTDPESSNDLETLGILVSKHCNWELDGIAAVLFAALEDSNYHTLNERVSTLIKDYESELDAIPNPFD